MRRREMRSSTPLFLIVFFISFFPFFNISDQSLCLHVDLLSRKRKQLVNQPKEIIEEKGKLLPEQLKKQPGCQFDFLLLLVVVSVRMIAKKQSTFGVGIFTV